MGESLQSTDCVVVSPISGASCPVGRMVSGEGECVTGWCHSNSPVGEKSLRREKQERWEGSMGLPWLLINRLAKVASTQELRG